MFRVRKSIDIDFAHNVHGHSGPCLSIHGHTWKFELALEAAELDKEGFVADFKRLKSTVLEPVHTLLDHGYAVFADTLAEKSRSPSMMEALCAIGDAMIDSRIKVHGSCHGSGRWLFQVPALEKPDPEENLCGAYDLDANGIKVVSFPFPPTSERLAQWLYQIARSKMQDQRVRVAYARVYETLHPVESMAEYVPSKHEYGHIGG